MSLIKAVAIIASVLTVALPTHAQAREPVATRTVRFAELDLTSDHGAAVLYLRLQNAARAVCSNLDSRQMALLAAHQACISQALQGAVEKVDSAKVTQLHRARNQAASGSLQLASR